MKPVAVGDALTRVPVTQVDRCQIARAKTDVRLIDGQALWRGLSEQAQGLFQDLGQLGLGPSRDPMI